MAAKRSPLLMPSASSHAAAWCGNGPDPCWVEGSSRCLVCQNGQRHRCRCNPAACPSVSSENSRPPMKRAEGTGSPSALTLTSVSRAAIERHLAAADRHRHHPGAGRDDREGRRVGQEMRQQRGVGIVEAAEDRRLRVEPGSLRQAQAGSGRAGPWPAAPAPSACASPCVSTSDEKSRRPRVPQIGVAAERGHLVGGDAGQPQAPSIAGTSGSRRPWRIRPGKRFCCQKNLRAEIEADRQARRAGFGEGRADRVIVRRQSVRAVELIVEHRQRQIAFGVDQRAGRAMRGDRDRVDALFAVERWPGCRG